MELLWGTHRRHIAPRSTFPAADHALMTVGETPFTHDASALAEYVLPRNKELNMVFNFELMDLDSPAESPLVRKAWRLAELKAVIGRWQTYKRDEGYWNA